MPQMAPINWLILLIIIFVFMLIISSLNFYNFLRLPFKKKLNLKVVSSWKW